MKAALLPDRGVVKVDGDDARKFLNGLVTSDIAKVTPEAASFTALLTPQGKIIVDFILAEAPPPDGGGFFLTMILGVVGALVGGFLASALFDAQPMDEFFDLSTWACAIVGSVIVLGIYRAVAGRGDRARI